MMGRPRSRLFYSFNTTYQRFKEAKGAPYAVLLGAFKQADLAVHALQIGEVYVCARPYLCSFD